MRTFTNLAWPDDPYRASQQLYRRPPPMLAAFAVLTLPIGAAAVPAAVAVAYLPLDRTRVVDVAEGTVSFGFRAAAAEDGDGLAELVALADLDMMQARRHAAILAGHALSAELRCLREAAPGLVTRGLAGLEAGWADRSARRRGEAVLSDTAADLGGGHDITALCRDAGIDGSPACSAGPDAARRPGSGDLAESLAAAAAERALVIALACARGTGRYLWSGHLSTSRSMATAAWDLFPGVTWQATS
jgi:hypothetical protein